MAADAAYIDGHVVAKYLGADHRHRFRLCRVHLAGHDARTGFVLRKHQFADAAARAGGQQTDVRGDMHQADGQCFQRTRSLYNCIMGGEGFKFIWGGYKGQTGQTGNFFSHQDVVIFRGVETGAHGSSA